MKEVILTLVIAVASGVAASQPEFTEPLTSLGAGQKKTRALAMQGDYNGMRNIAYSYAAPGKGEAGSKVGACAWYLLIPAIHKAKFHGGDIGNISVYCGKLSQTELDDAYKYAFRTLGK